MAIISRAKQRIPIPDINIIPEELRQPAMSSRAWFFLTLVLVFAYAIYSLYPLRAELSSEKAAIEENLKIGQQELRTLQALEPQVKELKEALSKLEARQKAQLSGWETFQKGQTKWRLLLDGVQATIPRGVTIDTVSQQESEITIRGIAPTLSLVSEYANAIRNLKLTRDLGVTYENRSDGNIAFSLRLVIRPRGLP